MKTTVRRVLLLGPVLLAMPCALVRANPVYDHVVVVMMENHGYDLIQSYGSSLPYINGVLAAQSASMTQAYGLQHPSQPNYFWTFSGGNQGISNDTPLPAGSLTAPNLAYALQAQSLTFAGYSEGLPSDGSTVNKNPNPEGTTPGDLNYARKHAPWITFAGLDGAGINNTFVDFQAISGAGNFSTLPTVSFVIPALEDDMHNYPTGLSVTNATAALAAAQAGDSWLQTNLNPYLTWAQSHNSLLVVTWDEDATEAWETPLNPDGLTDPGSATNKNQIPMLFAGANIVPGNYSEGLGVTNVNLLRTIESFYSLTPSGAQQVNATAYGIGNGPITDIFAVPEPATYAAVFGMAGLLAAGLWRRFGHS
jgi:acid phosphatase